MLLKELVAVCDELEVWDNDVDIAHPVYFYKEKTWDANEYLYLSLLEDWFLNIEVTSAPPADETYFITNCCIQCFREVYDYLERETDKCNLVLLDMFAEHYGDNIDDDETIAMFVEDIFTVLSQGYYKLAEDFCLLLGIKEVEE